MQWVDQQLLIPGEEYKVKLHYAHYFLDPFMDYSQNPPVCTIAPEPCCDDIYVGKMWVGKMSTGETSVGYGGAPPKIEILGVKIKGGWGGSHRHFWVDDNKAIFKIDFKITGGLEDAQYKVIGIADSDYKYCNEKKAQRARKAGYFGPGEHTIKLRKRIPHCVLPPDWVTKDKEWVPVKWKIKLKTENGVTLLDKDKRSAGDVFCVHWAYAPPLE
jgi:hypothetical protein